MKKKTSWPSQFLFITLGIILPKFCPQHHNHFVFCNFWWNIIGDSINNKNFFLQLIMNLAVLKKIGKTSKNCYFWAQTVQKRGHNGAKTIFFCTNNKSRSYVFKKKNDLIKKCFGCVMNLFLFSVMFSCQKELFPAKTADKKN